MAALRRILKYTPAVVLGLLVVAWFVGQLVAFGVRFPWTNGAGRPGAVYCTIGRGIIEVGWSGLSRGAGVNFTTKFGVGYTGEFRIVRTELFSFVTLPLPLLVLVILPFGVRHFVSLQIRTWHYLAYVALVAVDIAYYLWWQK